MSSAAATSALGTEVLAVQRLFYNTTPNGVASVFLLFSSQLLGYGLGGLFRGQGFHNVLRCWKWTNRWQCRIIALPFEDALSSRCTFGFHVWYTVQRSPYRCQLQKVQNVLDCLLCVSLSSAMHDLYVLILHSGFLSGKCFLNIFSLCVSRILTACTHYWS